MALALYDEWNDEIAEDDEWDDFNAQADRLSLTSWFTMMSALIIVMIIAVSRFRTADEVRLVGGSR